MPTFPYILYGFYRTRYAREQGLWRSLCGLFVLIVPPPITWEYLQLFKKEKAKKKESFKPA